MQSDDTPRTNAALLERTADWGDHAAWHEFVAWYGPYVRRWCREYRLDHDLAEEVCQQFWIELAEKMKTFRYDPSQRFRGWLLTRFRWRVLDTLRRRGQEGLLVGAIDESSLRELERSLLVSDEEDEGLDSRRLLLLEIGEQVQAAVRAKIQDQSWQVFCHIELDRWTTRDTANALNMSYLAAYSAYKRVAHRLAVEGQRRLAELMDANPKPRPAKS